MVYRSQVIKTIQPIDGVRRSNYPFGVLAKPVVLNLAQKEVKRVPVRKISTLSIDGIFRVTSPIINNVLSCRPEMHEKFRPTLFFSAKTFV